MPSGQKEPRCRQGERIWGQPAHRRKHEITTYNSKQVLIEESHQLLTTVSKKTKASIPTVFAATDWILD